MLKIGRPIEGISLNGFEYLLEEEGGKEKLFETQEAAKEFLIPFGITEEHFDSCSVVLVDADTNEII
jgi:hypothetical protein